MIVPMLYQRADLRRCRERSQQGLQWRCGSQGCRNSYGPQKNADIYNEDSDNMEGELANAHAYGRRNADVDANDAAKDRRRERYLHRPCRLHLHLPLPLPLQDYLNVLLCGFYQVQELGKRG